MEYKKNIILSLLATIGLFLGSSQLNAWGCSAEIYQAPNGARVVLMGDIHGTEDFAAKDRAFKNRCMPKLNAIYNNPAYHILAEGTQWRADVAAKKAPENHTMLDHLLCTASEIDNVEVQDLREGAPLKLVIFYTYNYCSDPESLKLCVKSMYMGFKGYDFTAKQLITTLNSKIAYIRGLNRSVARNDRKHIESLIQRLEEAVTMINTFDIDTSARFLDELAAQKISHKQFVALGNILREELADVGYLATIVNAHARKKHVVFLGGTAHCMNVETKLQAMGYTKVDAIAYKDAPLTDSELEKIFTHIQKTVYNPTHTMPGTTHSGIWHAIAQGLAIVGGFLYHIISKVSALV